MTPEQRAVLIADLEYRARYLRQPEVASFRIGDLADCIACEIDRAIGILRGVAPAAPSECKAAGLKCTNPDCLCGTDGVKEAPK